ncbi:MAG: ABC transporter permease [Terriglobia bacterium]
MPIDTHKLSSADRNPLRTLALALVRKYPELGVTTALCLFAIFFAISAPGFATLESLTAILTVAAELGMVAVGVSFLMVSGEFDISVGSILLLSTFIFCSLANRGLLPPLAFIITSVACVLTGIINAFITIRLQIPSFITTLGSMMFWRGIVIFLTGGFSVTYQADASFLQILGGNPFSMFRNSVIWFVILTGLLHLTLNRTRYGNWVYATGGNSEAARNVGVPINRVKVVNFGLCSLLAGIAGMTNLARFMVVQGQLGTLKELESIAAAVIGGNLLSGGRGSILGTFVGAVFISMLRTGLIMMGFSSYLYMPLTGVMIVLAVILNRRITNLRS